MLSIPDTKAADIPVGLGEQFRRQAPRYAVGTLLLGAYQYCQYWFDTRLSIATDAALSGATERVLHLGILLVAVAAFALLLRVWSRIALFNGGRIAEYELRKALLHHLFKLGPSFYQRMSVGDVMSRSTNDLMQVRMMFGFGVLNAVNTVFAFISALAVTLQISVKLTFASLATMPLLFVVMGAFSRMIFQRQRQNQEALGAMSTAVQSSISGVRVVRSFALETEEARRFEQSNRHYLDVNLSLARVRGVMFPIMQAITALGTVVVLLYGGSLLLDKQLTSGQFLAFYRALSRLTWPLVSVGFLVSLVQRGRAAYTRLHEVFQSSPDIVDGPLPAPVKAEGQLAVMGLSYAYGNRSVLDDVSFLLPPGGSLAIVGRTGSGKSTLASLLARLLATPRGTVFLDGRDLCDLPLQAVRSTIGYCQQTAFLFSTTIGRNIGYVLDDPDSPESMARARLAAEEAQILAEIEELPDGFDTVVGERGVQLSGGQKQRVALARGLLSGPPVLVLDDPLSAVDARTESAILRAIDRQRAVRSVVLITHRVTAASRCDQILVLDAGKVVEQGTHAELLRKGGLYAAFAEEQRIESELAALAESDAPPAPGAAQDKAVPA
jgi:ATP-binding cassette, subfamily B, multidrug efflux pump